MPPQRLFRAAAQRPRWLGFVWWRVRDPNHRPATGDIGMRRAWLGKRARRGQRAEGRGLGELLHQQRALVAHAAHLLLAHLHAAPFIWFSVAT